MNRPFKESNVKDKFAVEHIVPFLLERIEQSDDSPQVVDLAASLCVFPYKTIQGTRLGCLGDPSVQWYFVRDDKKGVTSTDSYRILDSRVLKSQDANKLKGLLSRLDLISEYSETVVINELIDRMSTEQDYTASWWDCAFDVYGLWKKDETRVILSDATESIENDAFLFSSNYCSNKLRDQLIQHGVYRDIRDEVANSHFWNRLPRGGETKARELLKDMGVPSTFVIKGRVSHRILDLINRIARDVDFDGALSAEERDLCDLCHQIIFERIFREARSEFERMTSSYAEANLRGIPILNARGEYTPLSLDLFCSANEVRGNQPQSPSNIKNLPFFGSGLLGEEQERTVFPVLGDYERLHVDAGRYSKELLDSLSNVHLFEMVNRPFSEYSLGLIGERFGAEDFYRWVWNHSQHEQFARLVLRHFSGDEEYRSTVPKDEIDFVLDVLASLQEGDELCCFDIDMVVEEAFKKVDVLNSLFRLFPGVFPVVYGDFRGFDPHRHLESVLENAFIDPSTKRTIRLDPIWEHTYLTSGVAEKYYGDYLFAKRYLDDSYEESLILWPSLDEASYVISIARYIDERYGTSLEGDAVPEVDWSEEYRYLVAGIREFLSEHRDTVSAEETYGKTARLDDVQTFGQEKRIWFSLKEQRDAISGSKSSRNPIGSGRQREYLSSTYQGRCQLCGGRTAKSIQDSYFWTFRMVKESQNRLANLTSNIFCLCPSCHGELQYGSSMGKDLSELVDLARRYAARIEKVISAGEFNDDFQSAVSELESNGAYIEGFYRPIVCDVVVNGTVRHMAFSWEHFMRLAFMFTEDEA